MSEKQETKYFWYSDTQDQRQRNRGTQRNFALINGKFEVYTEQTSSPNNENKNFPDIVPLGEGIRAYAIKNERVIDVNPSLPQSYKNQIKIEHNITPENLAKGARLGGHLVSTKDITRDSLKPGANILYPKGDGVERRHNK